MAYKVIVSPRAQKEIENVIDYYALYSTNAPANFITALKEAYTTLETNPFFGVRYKNVRALKIRKFPYSLYFIINEEKAQSGYYPASTINVILIEDQDLFLKKKLC